MRHQPGISNDAIAALYYKNYSTLVIQSLFADFQYSLIVVLYVEPKH